MKRLALPLLLLLLAAPLWGAKKFTIADLKQELASLQEARKSDEEIATQLKQVELSEQLTPAARESLQALAPGPLTSEQLDILAGRSAVLVPPASDLPNTPPPDSAAQKALLAKTADYVAKVYTQDPHLIAERTSARYQDGVESIRTNSGMLNNMPNSGRSWELPNMFMRYIGTTRTDVESNKGEEVIQMVKQEAPWNVTGQITQGSLGPSLSEILQEATAAGTLSWKRWQLVNGHPIAVLSFSVPKKKSHYAVHYCCFPVTEDTGRMGYEGTGANLQYNTTWKDFKSSVGYLGELYIAPDSGFILRVVTQAELKPTDFVHQQDTRIDYAPVSVDGANYMLPVEAFTLDEVVPNGDNYAARYSIRHTLFHMTYTGYHAAGK